jgi:HSP20 family molecular chaperone IbpA
VWRTGKAAFDDFEQQVDRLFEELVHQKWDIAAPTAWHPLRDLYETPDEYLVVIDLPDVPPEEVLIQVNSRHLLISGQRRTEQGPGLMPNRCERKQGKFERRLVLPQPVIPERAQAMVQLGTCRIHLPKDQGEVAPASAAALQRKEPSCNIQVRHPEA